MLYLSFQIANERYALDARKVVEVIPLVAIRRLPHSPKGVAGFLNHHGRPVPAVDLSEIVSGQPAPERLSTRIIIIDYPDRDGKSRRLGLVAEQATEVVRIDERQFVEPGLQLPSAPFLGRVLLDPKGSVHLLDERALLPEAMHELLFADTPFLEA